MDVFALRHSGQQERHSAVAFDDLFAGTGEYAICFVRAVDAMANVIDRICEGLLRGRERERKPQPKVVIVY